MLRADQEEIRATVSAILSDQDHHKLLGGELHGTRLDSVKPPRFSGSLSWTVFQCQF
jgi:hypothetical protein